MKSLDKYKLKKKIKNWGKLSWNLLVGLSKITIIVFVIMTCFVYWINLSEQIPKLSKPILNMVWSVILHLMIIAIDYLIKLKK